MKRFVNLHLNTSFNLTVVMSSLGFCATIILAMLIQPTLTLSTLKQIQQMIFHHFSWFYVLSSAIFLLFLSILMFSRFGQIKLGADTEDPEFSLLSWYSLLFTAGVSIALIFLGVAEPISHAYHHQADQQAIFHSIFHWSVHAWSIYGVIALAIAYFGFRYQLPLSLRSCFYPLLKDKINGGFGNFIDCLAVCTTFFGLITTLAYSAIRLTVALNKMGILTEHVFITQAIVISVFILAILISMQRISKGLRLVSEFSLIACLFFLFFILMISPTAHLLNAFTENIGYYFSHLFSTGLRTYIYQTEQQQWFMDWTVFYWAWWFSWAPAFGIFIARISRGRTIREFILGVLIVPSVFFILWFSVFGNGALWVNQWLADGTLTPVFNQSGELLFSFLNYLPVSMFTQLVALLIILLFFITTIDFGIYTLNNISSNDKSRVSPRWQSIMWGAVMSGITLILYHFGGTDALHSTMLLFSLPFAMLMLIMMVSLIKGLSADYHYFYRSFSPSEQQWRGHNWQERLQHIFYQHHEQQPLAFAHYIALPALRELSNELIEVHNLQAHIEQQTQPSFIAITLLIHTDSQHPFQYQVYNQFTPEGKEIYLVSVNGEKQNYELQHLNHQQVIIDVLLRYHEFMQKLEHRLHDTEA